MSDYDLQFQEEFYTHMNEQEEVKQQMEETRISKKDLLIAHLDYATDKQLDFVNELLSMAQFPNKEALLKLGGFDVSKTYDSATPIEYYRKIQELYPNFTKGNMIYDYSENSFGKMLNVNDLIVHRILKLRK